MEFQDLVKRRRMVRKFQRRPVPREVLMRVLEVARHAPSAGFSQGFDFVVLDEPSQIDRFIAITEHPELPYVNANSPDRAPCLVLPFANTQLYLERYSRTDKARFHLQHADAWSVPWWDVDTGMALMLVLLAAIEEGLGGFLYGFEWGREELLRELGVPEGCRSIGALGLGYPLAEEQFNPKLFTDRRRSLESMVHFSRW